MIGFSRAELEGRSPLKVPSAHRGSPGQDTSACAATAPARTSGHEVEPPVGKRVPEFSGWPASIPRPASSAATPPCSRSGSETVLQVHRHAWVPWRISYSPLIHQMKCYTKCLKSRTERFRPQRLSLRQDAFGQHSLCLMIGPEKPRNSAVFRGWLCTLGMGRRLKISL
jgi:hypothetical protein